MATAPLPCKVPDLLCEAVFEGGELELDLGQRLFGELGVRHEHDVDARAEERLVAPESLAKEALRAVALNGSADLLRCHDAKSRRRPGARRREEHQEGRCT
jgi:hypothetical protein